MTTATATATATRRQRTRKNAAAAAPHPPRFATPDEVLEWDDAVAYELAEDGRVEERNMGAESDEVAGSILAEIRAIVRKDHLGHVAGGGTGLRIFPDRPNRMPRADVIFVARGRLPGERMPEGHLEIPPDLVVEVISRGDRAAAVDAKAHEYLDGGVRLVWVVYPRTRSVQVWRPGGAITVLREDEPLTGEDVIPGFSCVVRDLFPAP